jgi:hypothetical protein
MEVAEVLRPFWRAKPRKAVPLTQASAGEGRPS